MGATRYKDNIFVTVPRRSPGIPSTLNVISAKASKGSSPDYKPFPNAKTNRLHVNGNHKILFFKASAQFHSENFDILEKSSTRSESNNFSVPNPFGSM